MGCLLGFSIIYNTEFKIYRQCVVNLFLDKWQHTDGKIP